jgi:hypothetical protein
MRRRFVDIVGHPRNIPDVVLLLKRISPMGKLQITGSCRLGTHSR